LRPSLEQGIGQGLTAMVGELEIKNRGPVLWSGGSRQTIQGVLADELFIRQI
jgi:hypothetical protein